MWSLKKMQHARSCPFREDEDRKCRCSAPKNREKILENLCSTPEWAEASREIDEKGNVHYTHPSGAKAVVYAR
jgi:hypothetical protein